MKKCVSCKVLKDESEFNKNSCKPDGLQTSCKECRVVIHARSYKKRTPEQHKRYKSHEAARRKRVRHMVIEYLRERPCTDCGEPDIVVLEFDHVRGTKLGCIARLIMHVSVPRVMSEIAKCDVVCANCHRRRTAKRAGWYKLLPAPEGPEFPKLMVAGSTPTGETTS